MPKSTKISRDTGSSKKTDASGVKLFKKKYSMDDKEALITSVVPLPHRQSSTDKNSIMHWKDNIDLTATETLHSGKEIIEFHRKRSREVESEFTDAVVHNKNKTTSLQIPNYNRMVSEDVTIQEPGQFHVKVSKLD